MATQRIISGEKTILEKDDIAGTQSNIAPAVPTYVISYPLLPLSLFPTKLRREEGGRAKGGVWLLILPAISLLTSHAPHQGRHRQAAGLHLRHDRRAHRLVLCDGQHGIQR